MLAKTNLPLLTLICSWVKVASLFVSKLSQIFKTVVTVTKLFSNFVKVVPKFTQICLKLQCFYMTIWINSYAFVFQQDLAKFFCGFQPWRAQDMANADSPKVTDWVDLLVSSKLCILDPIAFICLFFLSGLFLKELCTSFYLNIDIFCVFLYFHGFDFFWFYHMHFAKCNDL